MPFRVPVLGDDGKWTVVDKIERVLPGRVTDATKVEWPKEASGYPLGAKIRSLMIRADYQSEFPHVVEAIRAIGIPRQAFESWSEYVWQEQTMAALRTFYRSYKHSRVPSSFVVPRDDPAWPIATWGLRLGEYVKTLRTTKTALSPLQLEDLASVEFTFDLSEMTWSDIVFPSLEVFKQVHGHCRVPFRFTVPSLSAWPENAWIRLGAGCQFDTVYECTCFSSATRLCST